MSFEHKRPNDNKEIIFGIRPVIETIKAGKEIERLLIQKDQHSVLIQELIKLAKDNNIPITQVPVEKLNTITRKNHQGVICFISVVTYASLDHIITESFSKGETPLILILDRVTDVRNFGAIARTAECMGVNAIVIPSRGSAQINSDAVKTSAGALNFIPVCREDNLKSTLDYLKESGLQIVGCTEKADKELYDYDFNGPAAIILGSEENGISPEYLKKCDGLVKIPMTGRIESLNVSVAAGMILYEAVRQRK
ncbi:MAG: 23S rRNA (guanosine(2251)-2'-O)-methyltransferase RlmB [Cytophagaceae bacterium]|nr:23S rRNA (guanosine(2251)-2'-O)-methyltransferase RlmB [Cytophagaceae bacterium]